MTTISNLFGRTFFFCSWGKKAKPCVVIEGRGREEVLAEMFVWDALLI